MKKKMKIIITGGGTGGHIYPALSIAERIKHDKPGTEILYVGSKNGMESTIVPSHLPYEGIEAVQLNKKLSLRTIKSLWRLVKSFFQSWKIVKNFEPDVVIGTGGYVAGTCVLAAALRGVPTAVHEQNAFPGMTNRILSRFVDVVMLSFDEARTYFKFPEKMRYTGLPVMDRFFKTTRKQARTKLGFSDDLRVILTVGGSNGALYLNETMMKVYEQMKDTEDVLFVHISGKRYYKALEDGIKSGKYNVGNNLSLLSFTDDMPTYLNAADLVVSRAGASTVFEIIASKTPSVIIPSPNVANNHQFYNAQLIDKRGLGVVISESELTDELMAHTLTDFLKDPSKLEIMRANCDKIDLSTTMDKIADTIYSLAHERVEK